MPTYQYACTDCGHTLEAFQSFTDDALTECPVCGGKLRKVFNSVGIVFKGSGFYRTDSREKAASNSGNGDKGDTGDSRDTGGKSDKDAKPSKDAKERTGDKSPATVAKGTTSSDGPKTPSTSGSASGSSSGGSSTTGSAA